MNGLLVAMTGTRQWIYSGKGLFRRKENMALPGVHHQLTAAGTAVSPAAAAAATTTTTTTTTTNIGTTWMFYMHYQGSRHDYHHHHHLGCNNKKSRTWNIWISRFWTHYNMPLIAHKRSAYPSDQHRRSNQSFTPILLSMDDAHFSLDILFCIAGHGDGGSDDQCLLTGDNGD
ncbi:hypothetical protein BCR42DRAFT_150038 [Absidia repens]|uniref:Uncharacterized protein n=1 Tax=Absidia repens TaxID=90262 RepID=A0A1X2I2G9_9FUNG|nr:hypothetical protein BCR42DRAFT_150038 [Absidia repens]